MVAQVLLVDDVPEVRGLVRTALRLRRGFEVVGEAADGAEAIRLTEALRPDIVVLDLSLPDLAGQELLTQIRRRSAGSQVVVYTGTDPAERGWYEDNAAGFVEKDTHVDRLVDVLETLGHHTPVEATVDFPRTPASAGAARHFVADKLREWKLDPILDAALLVTSELAANAVVHADSSLRLRLSLGARTLRIDIMDSGRGTPEPQPRSSTEEHGRGLLLVAAMSAAWGIEEVTEGKTVWAELDLDKTPQFGR